jgi:hypothetical protein
MVARGILGHEQDFLDSLAVMEEGMRHFYARAIAAKQTKQPDKVIDAAMISRRIGARLSAMKLAGDPKNPARFKDDSTADELRAEVMRRLMVLQEAGAIDLQALPVPKGGIANQPAPGGDQSGLNHRHVLR